MKIFIRIISILVISLTLIALPVYAEDQNVETVVTSGECGNTVTWNFDDNSGTLTISGQGEMNHFKSAKNVPWNAFREKISSLVIEDGVTSVCNYACSSCKNLIEISFPDSLTTIDASAFSGCSSLKYIEFPTSLASVGKDAFYQCSGISDLNIADISEWAKISFENEYANPAYYASDITFNGDIVASVTVPDGVTGLKYNFENFTELVKVTLPESVNVIGDYSFYNCKNLIDINLTSNVESIGRAAFYKCFSLTGMKFPSSISTIGKQAFYNCYGLEEIKFSDGLSEIGDSAFEKCSKIKSIVLPESLVSIGKSAFASCEILEKISMGNGVTIIGSGAFSSCKMLKKVDNLSDNLISISDKLFNGCSSLEKIDIPSGVLAVGANAFTKCIKIKEVVIPNSVISIGAQAFSGCTDLVAVYFGGKDTQDSGKKQQDNSTEVSKLVKIGSGAFTGCGVVRGTSSLSDGEEIKDQYRLKVYLHDISSWCRVDFADADSNPMNISNNVYLNGKTLTELNIASDVDIISAYAFINAKCINSVFISDSLKGIGTSAFEGCTGVRTVKYSGTDEQWKNIEVSSGNETVVKDSAKKNISYSIKNVKIVGGYSSVTVPSSKFKVNFSVENLFSCDNLMVVVICYDSAGRFVSQSSLKLSSSDKSDNFNIPIDNRDGRIASYKLCSIAY